MWCFEQILEKDGYHYNTVVDNIRKGYEKNINEGKKNQVKNKKIKEFDFGGERYEDINKLKSLFKKILCRIPNNVPLKKRE